MIILEKMTLRTIIIFGFIGIASLFFTSCKTLDKNILIYQQQEGYAPCEPSIAINAKNHKHIVAGSVIANVHRSSNGGKSWTTDQLTSTHGVFGDPAITSSPDGTFFYCHLADPDHKAWASPRILESIVVQRSTDNGVSWNDGVAVGSNPPKDQDKEWISVAPNSDAVYMSWTEFDKYDSSNPDDESRILISTSRDDGLTWSDPIILSKMYPGNCLDDDDTVEGAVPAAGKNGKVFVAWAGHENIYFNRSMDYGETWLNQESIIAKQPGGWNLPIKGIRRVNGMPVTIVDNSGGPYDGRIYILWADQSDGPDNTNIRTMYSDDNGDNWSIPVQIHKDENAKHQFFPWLTIDQQTGFLYAVFYNRKAYTDLRNDVSLAWSRDGGVTWNERIISERPFHTPPELIFFGDYNNISAVNGQIRPIWTRYDEGYLSIWTALIHEKSTRSNKP